MVERYELDQNIAAARGSGSQRPTYFVAAAT